MMYNSGDSNLKEEQMGREKVAGHQSNNAARRTIERIIWQSPPTVIGVRHCPERWVDWFKSPSFEKKILAISLGSIRRHGHSLNQIHLQYFQP